MNKYAFEWNGWLWGCIHVNYQKDQLYVFFEGREQKLLKDFGENLSKLSLNVCMCGELIICSFHFESNLSKIEEWNEKNNNDEIFLLN